MPVINRTKLGTRSSRAFLAAISTMALGGGLSTTIAHADAYYHYYGTQVQVNGSTVSAPGHIATKDPFGGASAAVTSFLPIWYVDQALGKYGVTVNWGGTNGVLNLTTPSYMKINYPDVPKPVAINSGSMVIEINGKAVTYAPRISYYDEGSNIVTTFVPVWYIEEALKTIGIQTGWDGTHWTMQHAEPITTTAGETVKAAAAVAFAKAMGIQPDSSGVNPYSDVTAQDWPYIHALTKDYVWNAGQGSYLPVNEQVFTASSATTFGSDVTASDLDTAFQVASGLNTSHENYFPGGSPVNFATIVGLNKGVPITGTLSSSDVGTLIDNLKIIERGYIDLGGGKYQLVYRPTMRTDYWNDGIPASTFGQDWANTIAVINKTTVAYLGNGVYETDIPGYSDSGYNAMSGNYIDLVGGTASEQYSVNGGSTWKSLSDSYQSIDPNYGGQSTAPSSVLIKDFNNNGGGIDVTYFYNGQSQGFGTGGLWIQNGTVNVNYQ